MTGFWFWIHDRGIEYLTGPVTRIHLQNPRSSKGAWMAPVKIVITANKLWLSSVLCGVKIRLSYNFFLGFYRNFDHQKLLVQSSTCAKISPGFSVPNLRSSGRSGGTRDRRIRRRLLSHFPSEKRIWLFGAWQRNMSQMVVKMVIYHGTKQKIHWNKYNTSKSCLLKSYPDFPTIIDLDGVQTIILLISKCGNKLDSFL